MLSWLSGKSKIDNANHPLGSEQGIDGFLGELNPGRAESCLREISDALSEPQALLDVLSPEAFLRATTRLDHAAQAPIASVWREFLALDKIDQVAEQKLKSLDTIYRSVVAANTHCLRLLTQKPALGGSSQPAIAGTAGSLAQRALRAHVARARILHTRYRVPDAAWWASSAELVKLARGAGALNFKQRCYAEDAVPASPWIELLLGLFFSVTPLGNCNPRQMDLMFRILRWLEPHFSVSDSYSSQAAFFFHMDKMAAPKKALGPLPADINNVYFGPGLAYGHLIRLRSDLKKSNTLPDWMGESHCPHEQAMPIIDALIMHWSEQPPARVARRENRSAKMYAIEGFAQIRRVIAFSDFARSGRKIGYKTHLEGAKFERRGFADVTSNTEDDVYRLQNATPLETLRALETRGDKQMMDDWMLVDISESGIGTMAPFLKPWMVIGAYVAYRFEDEVDWQIGIIRRIHRKESGHPSLGVETLIETPICAQVRELRVADGASPAAELAREEKGQRYEDGIVVSQARGHVLIPKGLFRADNFLALSVGGNHEAVRMVSLVHSNADCDCVEFATLD